MLVMDKGPDYTCTLRAAPALLPFHTAGRVVLTAAPREEEAVLLFIWMQVEALGSCHSHSW